MSSSKLLVLLTFLLLMQIASSHWFGRYGYPAPIVIGGFGGYGGYGGYGRGFGYGGFYRPVIFGPPPPPPFFYR